MEKPTPQKRYCRAPNCDASSDSEKLFQSPPDPVRLQIWKDRVGLDEPVKMFYICRRHFSTRSFNTVQRTTVFPTFADLYHDVQAKEFRSEERFVLLPLRLESSVRAVVHSL
ncbi:hypothetical protein GE061_020172 [Apolygus lucorum]|uniref:THAP-type domain-containing protein n=1 Tax=Apolygus lucorum TaxID=248454 RepID=A0A8S9WNQ1_APOLU|nr:hypothetical protein GE061_020172 [Apolygus lucorum]